MAVYDPVRSLFGSLTGEPDEGMGAYDPTHERIAPSEPLATQWGHRLRYGIAAGLARTGDTVVDVGCGAGLLRYVLALRGGVRYYGIDRNLSLARPLVGMLPGELDGSRYDNADLETWTPPDDMALDLVVAFEVLEHVGDPATLRSWLRRARTLVLSVPIGDTGSPWHVRIFAPGEVVTWFPGMTHVASLNQPSEASEIHVFEGPAA